MQKAVEIESRGMKLRGTLHIPESKRGKLPIVIILHGFEGNRMGPHFIFVRLSRLLESKGIASVRFDFSGSGESDGTFTDMTLSGELADAHHILDYVKTLDYVDKSKIGVVGLSMGGAVAGMLAGARKEEVAALCLWAPAGNMLDLVVHGFIGEEFSEFERTGRYDVEGLEIGKDFVDDLNEIDIYGDAMDFGRDVLLIHGDRDTVVPVSASEKYRDIYGKKAELAIISGADHTFNRNKWETEVVERTVGFFAGQFHDNVIFYAFTAPAYS